MCKIAVTTALGLPISSTKPAAATAVARKLAPPGFVSTFDYTASSNSAGTHVALKRIGLTGLNPVKAQQLQQTVEME
jgi:hypothetical protein